MNKPVAPDPQYEALWPLARRAVRESAGAPRLPDLNGKTICELWDVIFRGETIYPQIREHIRARFPGAKFVEYAEFGNFYGPHGDRITAELPAKLAARGCDAAIVGIGA